MNTHSVAEETKALQAKTWESIQQNKADIADLKMKTEAMLEKIESEEIGSCQEGHPFILWMIKVLDQIKLFLRRLNRRITQRRLA